MMTFKKRRDNGVETAAFSAYMTLSREEVAAAEALAAEEGEKGVRKCVRRVATEAVRSRLASRLRPTSTAQF